MATLTSMNQGNPNNTRVDTFYGGMIPGVTVTAPAKKKNVLSSIFEKVNNFLTSGVGGVLTSLGGSLLQNHLQKKAEQRANAEWQRRFNVQSAYNDPSAQARRLRAAGINPLSALGNSVSQATNPSVSQSSAPGVDLSGGVQSATSSGLSVATTNTEKQNERIARADAVFYEAIARNRPEQFYQAYEIQKQELENLIKKGENIDANTAQMEQLTYNASLQAISEQLGWDLTAAEIDGIYSQIGLNEANMYRIYELTPAERDQFMANVHYITEQTKGTAIHNEYLEAEKQLGILLDVENIKNSRNERMNRTWSNINGTAKTLISLLDYTPAGVGKSARSLVSRRTERYNADGVHQGTTIETRNYE